MLDFDPEEFIITQPVWLVAVRRSSGGDFAKFARRLIRIKAARDGGPVGQYIAILTDQDQAERLIEYVSEGSQEKMAQLEAIQFSQQGQFETFLKNLMELGETHVALDPRKKHVPVVPITRFFEWLAEYRK